MHLYFSLHGRQLCVSAQAFTIHAKVARFQIRRLNRWYLSFSPREPEIAALNLALRLSILPKYDALDVVLLKVITNSLEISRHIQQNANTVFLNHIFFKSIWVCSEMRADCFVSGDQRVIDTFGDEEISIGDYVLTGGELASLVVADSVLRLQPGVLAEEKGYQDESYWDGLLEYPQFTRPEVWEGQAIPPVLLTGDHNKIDAWRGRQSRERTRQRRPDLYDQWCATHPITQIPRWKRTERAQLIKTDAQLDAAAKLFAEGCRTVCRDVCTEAGLAEYTPEAMRQRLEEERKVGWAFYLHTTSDTPDGMVGVCHKTGEIGHLFVTQSARGSGIGTKLLDFARKKLAEHARPWLAVLDVNTAAIGLYRRMGYLPDGVRNMYQPGVDVAFCKPCKELVMRYQPQDQG